MRVDISVNVDDVNQLLRAIRERRRSLDQAVADHEIYAGREAPRHLRDWQVSLACLDDVVCRALLTTARHTHD